jgi:hypothetical protein
VWVGEGVGEGSCVCVCVYGVGLRCGRGEVENNSDTRKKLIVCSDGRGGCVVGGWGCGGEGEGGKWGEGFVEALGAVG